MIVASFEIWKRVRHVSLEQPVALFFIPKCSSEEDAMEGTRLEKNPCMCNLYTVNTVITYTQSCNNTNRQNNYSTSKLFIEKQPVRCGGCLEQRGTAAVNSQGNPLVVVCARMKRCSSGSPCSSGGLKVDGRRENGGDGSISIILPRLQRVTAHVCCSS